jgi:hypothetical protein
LAPGPGRTRSSVVEMGLWQCEHVCRDAGVALDVTEPAAAQQDLAQDTE